MRPVMGDVRPRLEHRQPVGVEAMDDVAHGLVAAVQLQGDSLGSMPMGTCQQDLAAAEREGIRGPQAGLDRSTLLGGEWTNEKWFWHAGSIASFPLSYLIMHQPIV